MFDDESWIEALSLEESTDQLVDQSDSCSWIGAIHFVLLALGIKENFCLF